MLKNILNLSKTISTSSYLSLTVLKTDSPIKTSRKQTIDIH